MNITNPKSAFVRFFARFTVAVLLSVLAFLVIPGSYANAGIITSRNLTVGSSAGNTATTWTFTFTPSATTALKGITFQVCDAASGTCNIPGSWANTGSAYTSLTFNGSSQSGWTLDNVAGYLRIRDDTATNASTGPIVASFSNVTNPNTTNATFYVRILTYTGTGYTTNLDSGVVAASTSQQISLSGTMNEALAFCVGTSITAQDCTSVSGSSINLGTFSSSSPSSGTSVMAASTNANSGYSITVNGSTLTCSACTGTPTIAALASQTASSTNTAQFGMNLVANTTPSVGAAVNGSGSATATTNYGTANQYRFVSGDSVASYNGPTNANTFTTSYVVNVPGNQRPGTYQTTMTYIATAMY